MKLNNLYDAKYWVAPLVLLAGCDFSILQTLPSNPTSSDPNQQTQQSHSSGNGGSNGSNTGGSSTSGGSSGGNPGSASGGTSGGTTPSTPSTSNCAAIKTSTPLKLTSKDNNKIFENLDIWADGVSGIVIDGATNITLKNIRIRHTKSKGIEIWNSSKIRLEGLSVKYIRPPNLKPSDPNDDLNRVNISCDNTTEFSAERVRLEDGSSGIRTSNCPGTKLSFIEGHNFRGPWTTGPMVQFGYSDGSVLEDFSAENDRYNSFVEDIISVFNSSNCLIRRGLIDGNNSPAGVGVMFELHETGMSGGRVEDVDAVRQGNGCFAAYPANNITFLRTRCFKNICEPQRNGTPPASNAVGWAIHPQTTGVRIVDSHWDEMCNPNNIVWDAKALSEIDLSHTVISDPKPALRLSLCFEP